MDVASSDENGGIKCKVCKSDFSNEVQFLEHLKENPWCERLTCDVCRNQFTRIFSLKRHKLIHSNEKKFKCEECGYSTGVESNFRKHQNKHSKKELYKCSYCNRSTIWKESLDRHILRNHLTESNIGEKLSPRFLDLEKYRCEFCRKHFPSPFALKRHERSHSGKKPFRCDDCFRRFTRQKNLNKHKRIIHSTVEKQFPSQKTAGESTSKSFKHSEQSEVHSSAEISAASFMREEHFETNDKDKSLQSSERLWQCHQCIFTTNSEKEWFVHKQTHVNEAPCTSKEQDETDLEVIRASEILVNMRNKRLELIKKQKESPDSDTPPTLQQITGEGTSKTFKLSEQSEIHSSAEISAASSMREEHFETNEKDKTLQFSEKLWQCHQCRFTTISEREWFVHKQTHVDEASCTSKNNYILTIIAKFVVFFQTRNCHNCKRMEVASSDENGGIKCKVCKSEYSNEVQFLEHLKENPKCEKLTCDVCRKQFTRIYTLKTHKLAIHSNEKKFKCEECDYSTGVKSDFRRHQNKHSKKELYKCSYCNRSTIWKQSLDRHILLKHLTESNISEKLPPRFLDLEKYRCKVCLKYCHAPYALKRHERSHTGKKPFQCDDCFRRFTREEKLNKHRRIIHSTVEKQPSSQQITGESISKTIKNSEQSGMYTSAEISAASSTREEHLKTNEKDKSLQFSERLRQCHQCRFTTNSEKEWFVHRQTHVDGAPCTSKEQEEIDSEVVRASEILMDMRKKRLEEINEQKKSPDSDTPPTLQ
ncbi:zinc finger protein 729-like [Centruroides sculpturatus]|uniref:zinc finger protein 729-like n=1 Tax=Centruroides sculpturatus TaxID=218467 RepID=UPI000C6C892F|nr:zinc finger protein 729-like [Centruroides sculpturatus]